MFLLDGKWLLPLQSKKLMQISVSWGRTGEERQGRSVSAQLLTKDGDQRYSWAESQLLTPVCLLNYCFSGYMAQDNYRVLGVHRISFFRSKLFLCLCPAEYWVWYQLLALLLPQPGRCWDFHSTDILKPYDINWFQVICTIFFPSGTSKYALECFQQ